jgi:hypothetical protein
MRELGAVDVRDSKSPDVQNGNLASLRFSTSADPDVQALSSIIRDIDQMQQQGTLQVWPRPPIPEFSDIVSILGDEIHFMLQGQNSISAALATSQDRKFKAVECQSFRNGCGTFFFSPKTGCDFVLKAQGTMALGQHLHQKIRRRPPWGFSVQTNVRDPG